MYMYQRRNWRDPGCLWRVDNRTRGLLIPVLVSLLGYMRAQGRMATREHPLQVTDATETMKAHLETSAMVAMRMEETETEKGTTTRDIACAMGSAMEI